MLPEWNLFIKYTKLSLTNEMLKTQSPNFVWRHTVGSPKLAKSDLWVAIQKQKLVTVKKTRSMSGTKVRRLMVLRKIIARSKWVPQVHNFDKNLGSWKQLLLTLTTYRCAVKGLRTHHVTVWVFVCISWKFCECFCHFILIVVFYP